MFDLNTVLTFFAASFFLALAPGPDIIYVLTQSMIKGRIAGIIITLGLCSGLIVHTTLVALGIAVIFRTSLLAFSILKYAGAAYLLYLAWKAIIASDGKYEMQKSSNSSFLYYYRRGIIMNVTNPKVSVFFLAFLPQFANPENGSVTLQIILLGIMFIISALAVFSLISYFAGMIGNWFLKSGSAKKVLNVVSGIIFIILAVKLALAVR